MRERYVCMCIYTYEALSVVSLVLATLQIERVQDTVCDYRVGREPYRPHQIQHEGCNHEEKTRPHCILEKEFNIGPLMQWGSPMQSA
jgi:hypothetical protein